MKNMILVLMFGFVSAWAGLASAQSGEPNTSLLGKVDQPNQAQSEDTKIIKQPKGTVVIYFENDLFSNTDKYYTNAVQLRLISPPLGSLAENNIYPDALDDFLQNLQEMQNSGTMQYNLSLGLGQAIFTPQDIQATKLLPEDRPYAGYLYGFLALHAKQPSMMDTFELAFGVVGPSARAGSVQNEVHRIRNFDTAKGWDNQLKDEPAGTLTWTRNYRLNTDSSMNKWSYNILPYHSASVGNVLTQAALGCEVRYGWNMPSTFGTSLIRPGSSIDAPTPRTEESLQRETWGWYLFAGTEGRAIWRNIFLDGNTWKDSHSVAKEPLVADLNLGLAVSYNDIRVAYNHVYMTKEFKKQSKAQQYGSITLTIAY